MADMKHAVLAAVLVSGLIASPLAQGYVPYRVFDTAAGQFTDFEAMAADLVQADVVFVGEQHDDPNTHRLERMVLEALAARKARVILSLEMFERDTQKWLDDFQAGYLSEPGFLRVSRPWPRYGTDYKPLVDFAVERQWPVLAANVPRPIASEISKAGIGVLDNKPAAEKAWFAAERQCPVGEDEYYVRFKAAMGSHPTMDALQRFYDAQCVKDETMAESIAKVWTAATSVSTPATPKPVVVHYNGAFHSDFGLGTASRTQRRLPAAKVVVITMMPLADLKALDSVKPEGEDLKRARYLVYTVK
jgi:uncharacterized iron-regulated protein